MEINTILQAIFKEHKTVLQEMQKDITELKGIKEMFLNSKIDASRTIKSTIIDTAAQQMCHTEATVKNDKNALGNTVKLFEGSLKTQYA